MSRPKKEQPNKAYKYRIYPNKEQQILLAKTFGCCRKIWNLMLSDKQTYYKNNHKTLKITPAGYKQDYPYFKEVDSLALCNVQLNLEQAYTDFFRKKSRFPKFKSKKKTKKSYTTNIVGNNIRICDNGILLPKTGMIKAIIHRNAPNDYRLKSVTISQESDGKHYASVLYEYDKPKKKKLKKKASHIGLDYKSDGLYMDSNGNLADMPYYTRQEENRLKRQQRKLSRKIESNIKGYDKKQRPIYKKDILSCKNIQKQKAKIAKIYKKTANRRNDFLHKKSTEIANQFDIISIEDLNMKALSNKGFGNGKKTCNNAYGMFTRMLEYKQKDRNHLLIKIDKWFPSSQLCSCCGYQNPEIKDLKIRTWKCPECHTVHDRDINAAVNIDNEGYRLAFI